MSRALFPHGVCLGKKRISELTSPYTLEKFRIFVLLEIVISKFDMIFTKSRGKTPNNHKGFSSLIQTIHCVINVRSNFL